MPTEQITLTRALAELGVLEDRINKKMAVPFIEVVIGTKKVPNNRAYQTEEDVRATIEANFQSLGDLMKRREALKNAVAAANTVTKVKIGSKEMTIAEALVAKSCLTNKKSFRDVLLRQHQSATMIVNQHTTQLDAKVERLLQPLLSKDSDKNELADAMKQIKDTQYEQYAPAFCDPLGLTKLIEKMTAEIEEFELNVDFALSEVNGQTSVEVTY